MCSSDLIELFRAVAKRDGKQIAPIAANLLDPKFTTTSQQKKYLLIAAMAGYLMAGDAGKALDIWQRNPKVTENNNDLNLRLLYAHALSTPPSAR